MKQTKIVLLLSGLIFVSVLITGFERDRDPGIHTREQLGEKLFFDPILSKDHTISCASCHLPAFAFADTSTFSKGINGTLTKRNTPAITNLSGRPSFFWDGRAGSLEEQVLGPITSPDEMGLSIEEAVARVGADSVYREAFQRLFGGSVTKTSLLKAIASFERTMETADSPYDRYINGDEDAIGAAAKRGRLLFIGKGNCNNCHSGEDFTADRFKNIGLYNGRELNDAGRYEVTKDTSLIGFFKIPGLRNVAITAPYMHNGMFKTLKEVIRYYNNPDSIIHNGIKRDLSLNVPLTLTEEEINDLEAFLLTLTDDRFTVSLQDNR